VVLLLEDTGKGGDEEVEVAEEDGCVHREEEDDGGSHEDFEGADDGALEALGGDGAVVESGAESGVSRQLDRSLRLLLEDGGGVGLAEEDCAENEYSPGDDDLNPEYLKVFGVSSSLSNSVLLAGKVKSYGSIQELSNIKLFKGRQVAPRISRTHLQPFASAKKPPMVGPNTGPWED
jgi:hypothetical protein